MKRVIKGKIYNTETAALIGEGGGNVYRGDFRYYSEGLYLTPRGNFFLAGEGGPLSHYGRPAYGGGTCGGEGIIPLSREEALNWAQEHLAPEDIEEYFSDLIEEA
ncbi:MAG: hypothetical protein ACOYJV_00175 [Aminivibrio sp.]|jgi:hypothetical protein